MLCPLLLALALGLDFAHATKPCDIYKAGGTPCVAAHSSVRALFESYAGALYQVKRADGKTQDIGVVTAGGVANAATQDAFCKGSSCVVSILYDQSGRNNHLTPAPGGGYVHTADNPVDATRLPITINGQKAYGLWFEKGMGYRNDRTSGVATGDNAEAIYMVTSGKHVNGACCFDYGNAETDNNDDGDATMEALYFGTCNWWGYGAGSGPWVMADLENGLFACSAKKACPSNPPQTAEFVTAMLKGRSGGTFALKGGNAQSGSLNTVYDGDRPQGYRVMKKQGAILLGIGGDNSNGAVGSFYEGVMVSGNPGNDIDNQVQANIVAAGYGKEASGPTTTKPATEPTTTKTPATTTPTTSSGASKWGQCGGINWNGPTSCQEGKCVKLNDYYSQCQ